MCRKPALAATALIALTASLAAATVASADAAGQPQATATIPAHGATPAKPAAPRKATPAERAAADRLEPLARAAFWSHEAGVDPADTVAGTHLAAALRTIGQYDEAAQAAQRVLVIEPENLDGLLELARARIAEGQGFYGVAPAEHAEKVAPKDWRPLSLAGVAYEQVKRHDDAQAAWTAALALSPNNPDILSNMAMAKAAKGDLADAEDLLRRATAQPSANLQVRQNLALVLGIEGKLGEAESLMRRDLPPDQADADMAYLKAVSTGGNPAAPAAAQTAAPASTDAHSWASLRSGGG